MTARRRAQLWILIVILLAGAGYAVARTKQDFRDFEVYHTAAARTLDAAPLYRAEDGHYQYKYLPGFALAMTPFGLMPLELAKLVWYALSVGLLALFFRQAIHGLPERRTTTWWLAWLTLLLTGKFIVIELVHGQANILLGVLLMAALAAVVRKRPALAGVLVGLAVFVKPYALIMVPWIAVASGMRALSLLAMTLGMGLVAPALLYGWTGNLHLLQEWFQTVTSTTPGNVMHSENVSFVGMWARWVGEGTMAFRLAAATSVASLGVVAFMWLLRRQYARPHYLEVGALLLMVPLLSPQGWDYVLLLGLPALVCLIDRFNTMTMPWRAVTIVGCFLVSFVIYDLIGRTLYLGLMELSGVTVGALMLVACLLHLRVRSLA